MAQLITGIPSNYTEYPNSFKRQGAFPLEAYSIFSNHSDANNYVASNLSYVGQIIIIIENNVARPYIIQSTGLTPIIENCGGQLYPTWSIFSETEEDTNIPAEISLLWLTF